MDICSIIVFSYLLIGFILSCIWWEKEYRPKYENDRENEEIYVEEPMAVIFLTCLVLFWPFKLIKRYFEGIAE